MVVVAAFILSVLLDYGLWNLLISPAFDLPQATLFQALAGTTALWFVGNLFKVSVTTKE